MKVASRELGRIGIFQPLSEMSPDTGLYLPELFSKIAERYGFASSPNPSRTQEQVNKEGTHFRHGVFERGGDKIGIMSLSLFDKGIQADATTTELAEDFLDDTLAWAIEEFNLRKPTREPKRVAWSQVIVEFDKPLREMMGGVADTISKEMQRAIGAEAHSSGTPDIFRIAFNFDQTTPPLGIPATEFVLERRAGFAYSVNRYWSQAAMHTTQHIKLLEAIEAKL